MQEPYEAYNTPGLHCWVSRVCVAAIQHT